MMLQVKNINTYYDKSLTLRDVSLEVGKGEMIAILGRNGVGKSTTLKSIFGIVPPRDGSIVFKDEEILGKAPFQIARRGMGYVPEERRIFPGLTVRENLIMGIKGKSQKREGGEWTISRVYSNFPVLEKRENVEAGSLSGGEQQMLTLMRTLMGNPELMLIDEPSEGLSPLMVDLIFDIIGQIQEEGMSIILVDQIISFTCSMSKIVYIMSKGSVVYSGAGEEVMQNKDVQMKYLAV